jgi:hypothetical protein
MVDEWWMKDGWMIEEGLMDLYELIMDELRINILLMVDEWLVNDGWLLNQWWMNDGWKMDEWWMIEEGLIDFDKLIMDHWRINIGLMVD